MELIRRVAEVVLQASDRIGKLVGVGLEVGLDGVEEGIQRAGQEMTQRLFAIHASEVDERLMGTRPPGLEVVGKRSRRLLTVFGEVEVSRRLYRERGSGRCRFLLDEAWGLEPRVRMTGRFRRLLVELACLVSTRWAARVLGWLVPGVSAMTVWGALKRAGEACREERSRRRRDVFEDGGAAAGERRVRELYVEADEVSVGLQRSTERRCLVKLAVGYEGREKVGGERCDRQGLVGRCVAAGVMPGAAAWEEVVAQFGDRWALDEVERVWLGGDGASWPKAGVEQFPHAVYVLDRFHLRRRLLESLGHDGELHGKVRASIAGGNLVETMNLLRDAAQARRGTARTKVQQLSAYLAQNWHGIVGSPEQRMLGAIEGQVYHHIARRMKRHGARWTPDGADRMAHLLAANANGELARYIGPRTATAGKAARPAAAPGAAGEDAEAPWRARLPALYGPDSDRPWIKHVLREIARIRPIAS